MNIDDMKLENMIRRVLRDEIDRVFDPSFVKVEGAKRGFTIAEASHYIGRSESFIRMLVRENYLVGRRHGPDSPRATLTFLREDLDAFLDGMRQV